MCITWISLCHSPRASKLNLIVYSVLIDFYNALTVKAADSSGSHEMQNDIAKTDKAEHAAKERPSKKDKKKEKKEKENHLAEKPSLKSRIEKRLLVLPFEASVIALLLIILLGGFYVVRILLSIFSAHD